MEKFGSSGSIGSGITGGVTNLWRFTRFLNDSVGSSLYALVKPRHYGLIWDQMNIIGVRSVSIVMITVAFLGMILAVWAYEQMAGMNLEEHLGVLINISVVKELGLYTVRWTLMTLQ